MNNDAKKNVSANGAYSKEDLIWHQHSNKLLVKILELWPDKTIPVFDLGCGHNFYMNTMRLLGYAATGIDSVPYPGVRILDVSRPIAVVMPKNSPAPNVLSLEVGEHIPEELSDVFLDNICMFGGDVTISWAVEGQPGIGHINCQNNQWVISRMYDRGYQLEHTKTAELRAAVSACHCTWFKNTLMYFIKRPQS